MATKRCSKCKEVKSLEKFSQRTASVDGRHAWCKQCMKEYMKEYMRRRRIDNPRYGSSKEYMNEYYIAHHEERTRYACQYRANYPEKNAAQSRRRRARDAGADGDSTAMQFIELCEQYDNRCLCCGKAKKLTADHIVPLSKGGSNDIKNLQPLCQSCNSSKGTKTIDYRGTGKDEGQSKNISRICYFFLTQII